MFRATFTTPEPSSWYTPTGRAGVGLARCNLFKTGFTDCKLVGSTFSDCDLSALDPTAVERSGAVIAPEQALLVARLLGFEIR